MGGRLPAAECPTLRACLQDARRHAVEPGEPRSWKPRDDPSASGGRRGNAALRVLSTSSRPAYRGLPSCSTAWERVSRILPSTGNAAGSAGQRWPGLGKLGQVRARLLHMGGVGDRRACRVFCAAWIMALKVPKCRALGHWADSGGFRRIQTDPRECLQSPRFAVEQRRTHAPSAAGFPCREPFPSWSTCPPVHLTYLQNDQPGA